MNIKFVESWYAGSLPKSPKSRAFARFMGRSSALAQKILGRDVLVSVENTDSAYAKHGNPSHAVLPTWYFSGEVLELVSVPPKKLNLLFAGLFMGTLLHEVNHLRWSPPTIGDILGASSENFSRFGELATIAANIIEDVYIDSRFVRENPILGPFILFKNDVLFDAEPDSLLNHVIASKRVHWRDRLPEELRAVLVAAETAEDVADRSTLAFRLCELLASEVSKADVADAAGEVEPGESREVEIDESQQLLAKVFNAAVNGDRSEKVVWGDLDNPEHAERIANVDPDPRFRGFNRALRARDQTQRLPAARSDNGRLHRRNLHRIAIDGKVFHHPAPVSVRRFREIFFLVDLSGSMWFTWNGEKRLIEATLSAVKEAFKSVSSQPRTDAAVFGHTTTFNNSVESTVVYFAASRRSQAERIDKLGTVRRANNLDGYAIQAVGSKFRRRDSEKWLFVLSDGRPAGTGYGGRQGINHTRKAVESLREHGVNVISLSLTEEVVPACDLIYGKPFNVDASHDLAGQLKRVVQI